MRALFPLAVLCFLACLTLPGCEPTRAQPKLQCSTTADCPASGHYACNTKTGLCEACDGGCSTAVDSSSSSDTGGSDTKASDTVAKDAASDTTATTASDASSPSDTTPAKDTTATTGSDVTASDGFGTGSADDAQDGE